MQNAGDRVEERCFAAAVTPENGKNLPRRDFERDRSRERFASAECKIAKREERAFLSSDAPEKNGPRL